MQSRLCSLLNVVVFVLFVFPTVTAAQATPEHRWLGGVQGGQGARGADAFFDTTWHVQDSNGSADRDSCLPRELASSAYIGRYVNSFVHLDALIGARVGGSGCLPSLGTGVVGNYREYTYQSGSRGDQFATTSTRVVLEPGNEESLVRPRASVTVGVILGKWDPTATIAGGVGIGSSRTRLTVDVGEQLYWIKYQLRVRHIVNNAVVEEHVESGTQKPHGLAVHVGIQHAF